MARVTVEDCVLVVPNRFELCLIASNRAKNILSGSFTELTEKKEKPAVVALREIADNLVDVDNVRKNIISSIKNRGLLDEVKAVESEDGTTSDMIIDEIQSQQLKETTFVSENVEVDD